MKKIGLVKLLTGIALAASGVLAFANIKNSRKAQLTEAATSSVTLAGSFNSWSTTADPLVLEGDYYIIERNFTAGETFKIVVNGSDWVGDDGGITWCSGMGSEGSGQNLKVLTSGTYLIKAVKGIGDYGNKSYGVIFEKLAAGRYILGKDNDWQVHHGVLMAHDGQYTGSISLSYKDEIKIAYFNGSSIDWINDGYEDITPNANAYYCFGAGSPENGNHNIQCYAAGTYTFYYAADGQNYDGIYHISVAYNDPLTAQHLAAKLMGANTSSGAPDCKDSTKFPAMKTIFLGLTSSEKSTFRGYENSSEDQFHNAYLRYVAWAAANNAKPWESGSLSSINVLGSSDDTTNLIPIIIVISLVSVTAIGGFFFIKKRKVN